MKLEIEVDILRRLIAAAPADNPATIQARVILDEFDDAMRFV